MFLLLNCNLFNIQLKGKAVFFYLSEHRSRFALFIYLCYNTFAKLIVTKYIKVLLLLHGTSSANSMSFLFLSMFVTKINLNLYSSNFCFTYHPLFSNDVYKIIVEISPVPQFTIRIQYMMIHQCI